MRIARLGVILLLLTPVANLAADQPPLSLKARIERLEEQLRAIEADMGKVDIISESLRALRNEDLRKIQQDIRGAHESVDRRPKDDGNSKVAVKEDSASSGDNPATSSGDKPATGGAESTSGTVAELADRDALLGRTKTLEETVAALQQHLGKLDDIAEQLYLIRSEDLATIHREVRGASETVDRSVKVSGGAAAESETESEVVEQGTVIIVNKTSQSYFVAINGARQSVPPGTTKVKAAYGPLRVGLPGIEDERKWPVTHWQKNGDAYQMTLVLQARS